MTTVSSPLTADEAISQARALVPVLAERAAATESLRRLPDETFADLTASGLFRVTQPRRFGGSELPLTDIFEITSLLSQGCGSAGWTFSLLASHGWFLAQFPEQAQQEVWGPNPDAAMSTSLAGGAPAEETSDGYRIAEGKWRFSTGVHHADWVALLAPVFTDGSPVPDMRFLLIPRQEIEIIEDWRAAGLAGTGSCSIHARDVSVPGHRTVRLQDLVDATAPGREFNDAPVYRLPLLGAWQVFMAAPAIGIARAALDACVARAKSRLNPLTGASVTANPHGMIHLSGAAARIEAAEALVRQVTRNNMAGVETGALDDDQLVRTRRDCVFSVRLCVEAVEELFLAAGASTLDESSPIQRCWRDVHAVAQHIANNIEGGLSGWAERELGVGDGLAFG